LFSSYIDIKKKENPSMILMARTSP